MLAPHPMGSPSGRKFWDSIQRGGGPVTASAIAAEVGRSKTATYKHLSALLGEGTSRRSATAFTSWPTLTPSRRRGTACGKLAVADKGGFAGFREGRIVGVGADLLEKGGWTKLPPNAMSKFEWAVAADAAEARRRQGPGGRARHPQVVDEGRKRLLALARFRPLGRADIQTRSRMIGRSLKLARRNGPVFQGWAVSFPLRTPELKKLEKGELGGLRGENEQREQNEQNERGGQGELGVQGGQGGIGIRRILISTLSTWGVESVCGLQKSLYLSGLAVLRESDSAPVHPFHTLYPFFAFWGELGGPLSLHQLGRPRSAFVREAA